MDHDLKGTQERWWSDSLTASFRPRSFSWARIWKSSMQSSTPSMKHCVAPDSSTTLGMPFGKWPSSLILRPLCCACRMMMKAPASASVGGFLTRNGNFGGRKSRLNTAGSRATSAFPATKQQMLQRRERCPTGAMIVLIAKNAIVTPLPGPPSLTSTGERLRLNPDSRRSGYTSISPTAGLTSRKRSGGSARCSKRSRNVARQSSYNWPLATP
jgi:hypothetical protein